jgi:hypothetical protein
MLNTDRGQVSEVVPVEALVPGQYNTITDERKRR